MPKQTLIVIGGGAAGFFCAINAATLDKNLTVIILEKSSKVLSKVSISGGGRCNVTHACFEKELLITKYPRGKNFLKKAFYQFDTNDTIQWFANRGVALKTEADGRMFPATNTSETIVTCLVSEANKLAIECRFQTNIVNIDKKDNTFILTTNDGATIIANYICIAAGGAPKLEQYQWLGNLQHSIAAPVPSLFTFNLPNHPIRALMGVAVTNVMVKVTGTKLVQDGPILITHWGLSGPAILKLSAWGAILLAEKKYQFSAIINWLGSETEVQLRDKWQEIRRRNSQLKMVNKNPFGLPSRLWEFLLTQSEIASDITWSELTSKQQNKLINCLVNYEVQVSGKTTFKEEFVTAGGVEVAEIDVQTMESKKVEDLFFAGEIINVDGVTGGFNFQNAWTTGFIAAKAIAERASRN